VRPGRYLQHIRICFQRLYVAPKWDFGNRQAFEIRMGML
jgi:hypothetical protein